MNALQHEGPWSVGSERVGVAFDEIAIEDANGSVVCGVWEMGEDFNEESGTETIAAANAEFIVRACNAHAGLIRALSDVIDDLIFRRPAIDDDATAYQAVIDKAQAAYDLAGGL
jgi:hypothetical protein